MGLYDGRIGAGDIGSTAHVAALLDAPVLLVVDAAAQGRSVAALVHGFRSFGRRVRIAGVILNRVGSDRHEQLLRDACDEVGTPVLGVLRRPTRCRRPVPPPRPGAGGRAAGRGARRRWPRWPALIAASVDLDAVLAVARTRAAAGRAPVGAAGRRSGRRAASGGRGGRWSGVQLRVRGDHRAADRAPAPRCAVVDPLHDETLPAGTRGAGRRRRLPRGVRRPSSPPTHRCAPRWPARRDRRPDRRRVRRPAVALPQPGRRADVRGAGRRGGDDRPAHVGLPGRGRAHRQRAGAGRHPGHRARVPPHDGAPRRAGCGTGLGLAGRGPPEGFVAGGVHASYLHLHWAGQPSLARNLVTACR